MDEIVNKVAQSSLMVFDLEDYYPDNHVVEVDISQWLVEGFLLKEADFRAQLKDTDWSKYEDKYVALYCATDAILPAWAFALVAVHLTPFALHVIHGTKEMAVIAWYQDILNKFYNIPNSNFASSLIKSLLHGGSNVISTSHDFTASIDFTFSSTSCGNVSATGQFGDVKVMTIFTSLSSLIITS